MSDRRNGRRDWLPLERRRGGDGGVVINNAVGVQQPRVYYACNITNDWYALLADCHPCKDQRETVLCSCLISEKSTYNLDCHFVEQSNTPAQRVVLQCVCSKRDGRVSRLRLRRTAALIILHPLLQEALKKESCSLFATQIYYHAPPLRKKMCTLHTATLLRHVIFFWLNIQGLE